MTLNYADYTAEEKAAYDGLRVAQDMAFETSCKGGWHIDIVTGELKTRNFGEAIALCHSELSEALEADRKGLMDDKLPHRDGREVELADCVIRILDLAQILGLNIAAALIEKNRFNLKRLDHKVENRLKDGGKSY
jgi:NTP pyrophosphatase (non-canonical NTP hydrolase)